MSGVVLGLDLGTSGVRVIAVDHLGIVIAHSSRSYPLLTPQPGWTEQNPADWVKASLAALQEIAQKLDGSEILALGLSGQMHGMVPLDAEGSVIRLALLWNDQRTGEAVQEIEAGIPREELIQRSGNPAITGFQLPKILWLRREEPEAYARLCHVLLPKDYLGYVLTGAMHTEPSDASGVGCLNLVTQKWDLEILNGLNLDPGLFPSLIPSHQISGHLKASLASSTGLPFNLPIIAGGGDNAAAAIGLGITQANPRQGSLSIGTSGVIFAPLAHPTPDPEGRIHLFCHVDGGYHLLGVTLSAAGSLRWYQETFAPQTSYDELMGLAAQSPPGSQGVLFLPHLAGERTPYLDPNARAAWIGLSLASQSRDVVRALLEGVAFSLKVVLEVMQPLVTLETLLTTGGGSKSSIWVQILADVLEIPLVRPSYEEGAAYGAAILAMVGAGVYPTLESALTLISTCGDTTIPQINNRLDRGFKQFKALYSALKILP